MRLQVVVASADLNGFENQFPEVNQIVTGYDDHQSAPASCVCLLVMGRLWILR